MGDHLSALLDRAFHRVPMLERRPSSRFEPAREAEIQPLEIENIPPPQVPAFIAPPTSARSASALIPEDRVRNQAPAQAAPLSELRSETEPPSAPPAPSLVFRREPVAEENVEPLRRTPAIETIVERRVELRIESQREHAPAESGHAPAKTLFEDRAPAQPRAKDEDAAPRPDSKPDPKIDAVAVPVLLAPKNSGAPQVESPRPPAPEPQTADAPRPVTITTRRESGERPIIVPRRTWRRADLDPPREEERARSIIEPKPQPALGRPQPAGGARPATLHAEPEPMPAINVTIGRIEIRATQPAAGARTGRPFAPKLSLDDYLRSRNGGNK